MTVYSYPTQHPLYKSLAVSLLFSVFLGPLGLLYTSVYAGTFMLLVAFIVVSSHIPAAMALMWVLCSVWSVSSTNRYNAKLLEASQTPYEEKNLTPKRT